MTLSLEADALPLKMDPYGVVRVSGSRVTLHTVIGAFKDGETPEGIYDAYSSVPLADIYAVIAYYLRRQAEVDAYLREQEKEAEKVRLENEARFDPAGIRERLLARRSPR